MKHLLLTTIAAVALVGGGESLQSAPSLEAKSGASTAETPDITIHELPRGKPEEVDMSSEGLKKIDELVKQYIDAGRIEGAVIGIVRQSKVVYLEAHGILEGKTPKPMLEDSIFLMASSTKPVIGVATMILIDDGLISPEDPVSKYIPEYKGLQVAIPLKSAGKGFNPIEKPKTNQSTSPGLRLRAKKARIQKARGRCLDIDLRRLTDL